MSETVLSNAPEPAAQGTDRPGPSPAAKIEAQRDAHLTASLAGYVSAKENAEIEGSAASIIAAGRDMTLTDSLGQVIASGRDLHMENSAALLVKPGKDARIEYSGSLVFLGQQTSVKNSRIGVALAREIHLAEGSRVLLSTPQALAFGAAFGAVCAVLGWLLRRR